MTNNKLWEQISKAATEVKAWPEWKKGSSVNSPSPQSHVQAAQTLAKR